VTRSELKSQLRALSSGEELGLSFDVYADMFPPGEPDENARQACYAVAKRCGCKIEVKVNDRHIRSLKL